MALTEEEKRERGRRWRREWAAKARARRIAENKCTSCGGDMPLFTEVQKTKSKRECPDCRRKRGEWRATEKYKAGARVRARAHMKRRYWKDVEASRKRSKTQREQLRKDQKCAHCWRHAGKFAKCEFHRERDRKRWKSKKENAAHGG